VKKDLERSESEEKGKMSCGERKERGERTGGEKAAVRAPTKKKNKELKD